MLKTHTEVIKTLASRYPVSKVIWTYDIDDRPPIDDGPVTITHLTGRLVSVEMFNVPRLWEGDYA